MAIKPELLIINSPEEYQTLASKRREGHAFFLLDDIHTGSGTDIKPEWLMYSLCGLSLTAGLPFKQARPRVILNNLTGATSVAWNGTRSYGRNYNYYKHVNPLEKRFKSVMRDAFNYSFLRMLSHFSEFPLADRLLNLDGSDWKDGVFIQKDYWEWYNIFRPFIDIKHINDIADGGKDAQWEFTAHLLDGLLTGSMKGVIQNRDPVSKHVDLSISADGWLIMYRNDLCHIYKVSTERVCDYSDRWDNTGKMARLWWSELPCVAQQGSKNIISHTVVRKARQYSTEELISMAQTETLLRKGLSAGTGDI